MSCERIPHGQLSRRGGGGSCVFWNMYQDHHDEQDENFQVSKPVQRVVTWNAGCKARTCKPAVPVEARL